MPYIEILIGLLIVAGLAIMYNGIQVRRKEFEQRGFTSAARLYRTIASIVCGMILIFSAVYISSFDAEDFNDITGAKSIIRHSDKTPNIKPISVIQPDIISAETAEEKYIEQRDAARNDIYNLTRGIKE